MCKAKMPKVDPVPPAPAAPEETAAYAQGAPEKADNTRRRQAATVGRNKLRIDRK